MVYENGQQQTNSHATKRANQFDSPRARQQLQSPLYVIANECKIIAFVGISFKQRGSTFSSSLSTGLPSTNQTITVRPRMDRRPTGATPISPPSCRLIHPSPRRAISHATLVGAASTPFAGIDKHNRRRTTNTSEDKAANVRRQSKKALQRLFMETMTVLNELPRSPLHPCSDTHPPSHRRVALVSSLRRVSHTTLAGHGSATSWYVACVQNRRGDFMTVLSTHKTLRAAQHAVGQFEERVALETIIHLRNADDISDTSFSSSSDGTLDDDGDHSFHESIVQRSCKDQAPGASGLLIRRVIALNRSHPTRGYRVLVQSVHGGICSTIESSEDDEAEF